MELTKGYSRKALAILRMENTWLHLPTHQHLYMVILHFSKYYLLQVKKHQGNKKQQQQMLMILAAASWSS